MCFFIAGVQPKTRTVETAPRRCPQCGLHQAYLQQTDHYISLFFIPLIPIKRGTPYLFCRRCQQPAEEPVYRSGRQTPGPRQCSGCQREIEPQFSFCPHCGRRQSPGKP